MKVKQAPIALIFILSAISVPEVLLGFWQSSDLPPVSRMGYVSMVVFIWLFALCHFLKSLSPTEGKD